MLGLGVEDEGRWTGPEMEIKRIDACVNLTKYVEIGFFSLELVDSK